MSKIDYKIRNIKRYTLTAFQDFENSSIENCLNNLRKACEAICRAFILEKFGESDGEKIILGEIKKNLTPIPIRNGQHYSLRLKKLLNVCKSEIDSPLYHRLEDIRFGGNNASHDPIRENNQVTEKDAKLCITQYREISNWFWKEVLERSIPLEIEGCFNGNVYQDKLIEFENSSWEEVYQFCGGFSREQKFVLIAPEKFKGITSNQLKVLDRINWHFIIDFNYESKSSKNGLFRILKSVEKQPRPITIEQKNELNLTSNSSFALNYYFANGLAGLTSSITQKYRDWRRKYSSFTTKLIKDYLSHRIEKITVICLSDDRKYIREIIQTFDENIASLSYLKMIVILQDELLEPSLRDELEGYEVNIVVMPFSVLIEGIRNTIMPKIAESGKIIQVPAKGDDGNGYFRDISKEYLSFLERDAEVLYQGISELKNSQERNIYSFYKGRLITWKELGNDIDVRREKTNHLLEMVNAKLKSSKFGHAIELYHRPGAGGTTLSRKVAYYFHKKYPTVIISKFHKTKTNEVLFELSEMTQKPILAIIESYQVSQNEFNRIVRKINRDKKHVVFLYVKRFFRQAQPNKSSIFLQDKMMNFAERDRFVSKFSQIVDPKRTESIKIFEHRDPNSCEIIDFALTAFDDEYSSKSLDKYVISYLEKFPESHAKFACYSSLVYFYTQNSTSEFWLGNIFPLGELSKTVLSIPADERYLKKLFIEEVDSDFEKTGYWKPKYNLFASSVMKLTMVGMQTEKKHNWRDFLHSWAIGFIKDLKSSSEYLTDDVSIVLESLFLKRDNEDFLEKDEDYLPNYDNKRFSRLIEHIGNESKQSSVFKQLVDSYPDEAHYRAHFGRFLYEKAKEFKDFELAESEIDKAIEFGSNDFTLWHVKGMCNRRKIEFLLRINIEEHSKEEQLELEELIQELTEEAVEAFENSRSIKADNLYSHTSQIQTLIKVVDFGRKMSNLSKEDFLTAPDSIWYKEQIDLVFNLLDEAKYQIEMSRDLERSAKFAKSREMISGCEGHFYQIMGNFSSAINTFKMLSENSGRTSRPFFRKMYVYATLAKKVGNDRKRYLEAWGRLSDFEYQSLKNAIENNIREQPDNQHHIKLWFQAVRNSNGYMSLDESISIAKHWFNNSKENSTVNNESLYYMYVLNACKAISEGDSFSEKTIEEAKEYLRLCTRRYRNDRYSFEWYGKGKGVKRLVNHWRLGGMTSNKKFFEKNKVDLLEKVKGIITNIYDRQSGKIRLACGLECFFVPIRSGFQKEKDITVEVSFYVGFRQTGLTAWQVERTALTSTPVKAPKLMDDDLEIDASEIQIEGMDAFEEPLHILPTEENLTKKENPKIIQRNVPTLKGLTIKGKIVLSEFRKKKK